MDAGCAELRSLCDGQLWQKDPFGPACSSNSRHWGMMQGLDDDFYCYRFKIDKCPCPTGHIWRNCPFVHAGEPVQRRHPSRHLPDICPRIKQGQMCPDGPQACKYAHNAFEAWLHPQRYKTLLCHKGSSCRRSTCFFAHSEAELRLPTKAKPPSPAAALQPCNALSRVAGADMFMPPSAAAAAAAATSPAAAAAAAAVAAAAAAVTASTATVSMTDLYGEVAAARVHTPFSPQQQQQQQQAEASGFAVSSLGMPVDMPGLQFLTHAGNSGSISSSACSTMSSSSSSSAWTPFKDRGSPAACSDVKCREGVPSHNGSGEVRFAAAPAAAAAAKPGAVAVPDSQDAVQHMQLQQQQLISINSWSPTPSSMALATPLLPPNSMRLLASSFQQQQQQQQPGCGLESRHQAAAGAAAAAAAAAAAGLLAQHHQQQQQQLIMQAMALQQQALQLQQQQQALQQQLACAEGTPDALLLAALGNVSSSSSSSSSSSMGTVSSKHLGMQLHWPL